MTGDRVEFEQGCQVIEVERVSPPVRPVHLLLALPGTGRVAGQQVEAEGHGRADSVVTSNNLSYLSSDFMIPSNMNVLASSMMSLTETLPSLRWASISRSSNANFFSPVSSG